MGGEVFYSGFNICFNLLATGNSMYINNQCHIFLSSTKELHIAPLL